jgi:hypothetical protein
MIEPIEVSMAAPSGPDCHTCFPSASSWISGFSWNYVFSKDLIPRQVKKNFNQAIFYKSIKCVFEQFAINFQLVEFYVTVPEKPFISPEGRPGCSRRI